MKEREAIKILRGDFSDVVLAENESHSDVFSKAFVMAIKALEKQALKTPYTWGDGYDPDGNEVIESWECPECGACYEIDEDYDYCPSCGQRIDWSDEE